MMYKDKKGKMQMEWVISIPDNDYLDRKRNSGVKFTGIIHVLDWKGNFIKSYRFNKDESVMLSTKMTFTKEHNLKVASNDQTIKPFDYWAQDCVTNTYWTCTTSYNYMYCDNFYTVTTCYNIYVIEPKGKEIPISEGGGSGGPYDYIPDENDCPVSGNPENPGDEPPTDRNSPMSTSSSNCDGTINRDTINNLNNADADCIFNKLKNNLTFQNLLNKFQNNANLNVTFQMGSPVDTQGNPVAGQTHHDPETTNFYIIIDQNRFSWVGAIEAANTFLHEAFHANLWINAQQWYPNSLPSNFQNMSLLDQIKYLDSRGGNGSIQHNYMASQINHIATALQEFTRVNYPVIYNNNLSYNTYLSMAHNGLQFTNCYIDFLNSLPGDNEKEKEDNLERLKAQLYTSSKCP
jgi:hypothetical protein